MGVTSWIILIFVFSGASFFASAALCTANRDIELAQAYKRGIKEGLSKGGPHG
jgi:hypothetical protein